MQCFCRKYTIDSIPAKNWIKNGTLALHSGEQNFVPCQCCSTCFWVIWVVGHDLIPNFNQLFESCVMGKWREISVRTQGEPIITEITHSAGYEKRLKHMLCEVGASPPSFTYYYIAVLQRNRINSICVEIYKRKFIIGSHDYGGWESCDLPFANQRARKAGAIIQSKSEGLRTKSTKVQMAQAKRAN